MQTLKKNKENNIIYYTVENVHVKSLHSWQLCALLTNKTNKLTKIFVFLSFLYVIVLNFFVNSLLKQH
jgi:hypothetical protein